MLRITGVALRPGQDESHLPRLAEKKNCFTISDKARCIAGSVLELVSGAARARRGKHPF